MPSRSHIEVRGVVQGIGFRPLVYRLANDLELTGFVLNNSAGVAIEIQGAQGNIDSFLSRLRDELPTGGVLRELVAHPMAPVIEEKKFAIASSEAAGSASSSLAPDRFACPKCLEEMRNSNDRRYKYPFINCTDCGPRFTIAKRLPYDRPWTTMAEFDMCDSCRTEYEDPANRRYHAQPIACPVCGPHLKLAFQGGGAPVEGDADCLSRAAQLLRDGKMIAVKGIGGFHLAVDARNEGAVERLRMIKRRPRKPLAVMAKDLETARRLVVLTRESEELLLSPAAPIVIAKVEENSGIARWIAPGLKELGVMLPYAPIQHLLFDSCPEVLVMTSGNPPGEPISKDDDEALSRLEADAVLLHDRKIETAADDSVIRFLLEGPVFLRRSRGYVPEALDVGFLPRASILALGAELKSTVAALHNGELTVGRHLGDMTDARTCEALEAEVRRVLGLTSMEPEAVAVDLHPDLFATVLAEERFSNLRSVRVQHHHAHMAAVMVEHGLGPGERVAGIILDGAGFGADGTVWGGEVLVGGYADFERVGHLRPIPMPGGDRAALEPRRMATSMLWDAGESFGADCFDEQVAAVAPIRAVSPLTSSAGRIFDGVAALLGVAPRIQDYEGEAAALLEAAADSRCDDAYEIPCEGNVVDTRALTEQVCRDEAAISLRAARFINGLADALAGIALDTGQKRVVLGGGCMVNGLLVRRLKRRLAEAGREALTAVRLPPGDGGLSAGQAACAACVLEPGRLRVSKE